MSEELKPCPFCKCLDPDKIMLCDDLYGWIFRVKCINCGAEVSSLDNMEQAIHRWNTSPAEDALKEEVERLKCTLEKVKNHLIIHRDHSIQSYRQDGKAYQAMNEFMASFCNGLIELINTDTWKGGVDE